MIDPDATAVIDLPWEVCKPKADGTRWHEHDTVTIRTEYGYGDTVQLARVHTLAGRIDPMAERVKLLEIGVRDWSLVDADGKPIPVGAATILLLPSKVGEFIGERIDEFYATADDELPNP